MTKSRSNAVAPNAKGTLVVGNGTDASTTLAVASTAGYVLTVDSAEATGLKWAAASSPSFVGCRIRKSTSQSIANNTTTTITFNEETYDTDGFHDNSVNNSRITIPTGKSGYYQIFGNIVPGTQTAGQWNFSLWVNNSLDTYYPSSQSGSASNRSVTISDIRNFSAGDYLELKATQDSGGSINIFGTDNYMTFWGVRFLG